MNLPQAKAPADAARHFTVTGSGVVPEERRQEGNLRHVEAFCPANLAGRPVFMVLPGGGYRHHADHEGRDVAEWLNTLGINAVVLKYSIAGDSPVDVLHPAPLQDARSVLAWLRGGDSGLAVDSSRIGVIGFSAGGHLAATISTGADAGPAAARPDLAVLCYPVVSMVSHTHEGSVAALLGPDAALDRRRALSAEHAVDGATPPTFLWHTADDGAVPVENSLSHAAALARHGVPFELHVFPHGRHGMGLAVNEPGGRHAAADWARLCRNWLAGRGWLNGPG
ncbi:acetyl esterase/lipase [Arthrobacter stackebrandtii]|uniref:Acetyl esterase/lipase n=1 Tax=Arthrobacter stackebrandtii TaxID=272161 RepID=A0ABS4YU86_9MICC|nr:alpha/beta hydrolase [Arthrobacter stackebrandtii]MBP2412351.1 acetyl esterase/lipase [Arthrobacter stackebrandtii]PYH02127.1 alpha/beta hydrolase [Arthrobacter stackebrandtii]